jgi:hypothetical protein
LGGVATAQEGGVYPDEQKQLEDDPQHRGASDACFVDQQDRTDDDSTDPLAIKSMFPDPEKP